jgi:rRNA-processing protein FCF1
MILFDSSAILAPFETGVDLVGGVVGFVGRNATLTLPFEALVELKRLSSGKPRLAGMARLALKTVEGFRILPPTGMECDDALIFIAKTYKAAVATADSVLRRRLRALGIPVFHPFGDGKIMESGFGEALRIV